MRSFGRCLMNCFTTSRETRSRWTVRPSYLKSAISIENETSMLMMISMPLALRSVWLFCFCGRAKLMAEKMINNERNAREIRPAMSRWRAPNEPNNESDEKTILLREPARFFNKASGISAKSSSNHHGWANRYPVNCVSIGLRSLEGFLGARINLWCRDCARATQPFLSMILRQLGDSGSVRTCGQPQR